VQVLDSMCNVLSFTVLLFHFVMLRQTDPESVNTGIRGEVITYNLLVSMELSSWLLYCIQYK